MKSSASIDWMPISDMMAGLMVVFLLISLLFINEAQEKYQTFRDIKALIYQDLVKEFEGELDSWGAEIDSETLTLRFNEPEILFSNGADVVTDKFSEIIKTFFPRYIKILTAEKYKDQIDEIRIEGHTSSKGSVYHKTANERYFFNLELSQKRSKNVLVQSLKSLNEGDLDWVKGIITASGYSSSRLVYSKINKKEDEARSRRVEFRVKVKTDELLDTLDFASKETL